MTYRIPLYALGLTIAVLAGCSDRRAARHAAWAETAAPPWAHRSTAPGRPAISTALVATFSADADARVRARNAYNRAAQARLGGLRARAHDRASASSIHSTASAEDQLLAADSGTDVYAQLRGVLLDDRLYVNSSADHLRRLPRRGRRSDRRDRRRRRRVWRSHPQRRHVIERSYSVLASPNLAGIDDLVTGDERDHSTTVFPFLAGPNN